MRIRGVRVQPFFTVILLVCLFSAGYQVTGKSVQARSAAPKIPEPFKQLDASAVSLKFYATETVKGALMPSRAYTTDFIRADTHYIWWELQLDAKAERDKPVSLFLKAVWQRPDGTEFRQSQTVTIAPDLQHPCLAAGWGYTKKNGWLPGTYQVTVLIDEIPVARGSFEIFEKLLKGP
jgi:hypothetical protein